MYIHRVRVTVSKFGLLTMNLKQYQNTELCVCVCVGGGGGELNFLGYCD